MALARPPPASQIALATPIQTAKEKCPCQMYILMQF